jgi:RNA polymerase sigma-70 factor (ECF subfamily)
MGDLTPDAQSDPGAAELGSVLERHRPALTGYCYRMLGSAFDAEDAVQETLVRAWRGYDRFEGRAKLQSWLYRIATNVCLDMASGSRRRARPMDLTPYAAADTPLGASLPADTWISPIPDGSVRPGDANPAEVVVAQETVRLAFVAALQYLVPRQRAVLILREVLSWSASEVAELLDTTVPAVNSALQRARSALAERAVASTDLAMPADATQRALLSRYVDAFQRFDLVSLVSLLHEEAALAMPPYLLWLRGPEAIRDWLRGWLGECLGARLVPVTANGSPAFGLYRPPTAAGRSEAWALQVLEISAGRIVGITNFLDTATLFPLFGLPAELDARSDVLMRDAG